VRPARTLEDRYQRLLALYPAGHRAVHEEEMLGVLMTAAAPGQRRPRLSESAALIRGAIRIWLRPGRDPAHQQWQDALAMVSVLLPLLMSAWWVAGQVPLFFSDTPISALSGLLTYSAVRTTGPWLIMAALALLGLRRLALAVTAGALIYATFSVVTGPSLGFFDTPAVLYAAAAGLETAALLASPGPRRGRQILTWKHYVLGETVAAAAALASTSLWPAHPDLLVAVVTASVASGLAVLAVSSPTGRRSAALLLIPAYYLVLGSALASLVTGIGSGAYHPEGEGLPRITLNACPLALAVSVAVIMAVRYIRRPQPMDPQPPAIE
jgi:hypothetical protein